VSQKQQFRSFTHCNLYFFCQSQTGPYHAVWCQQSLNVISNLYLLFYIFTKISEGGLDDYRYTKSLPSNNLGYS